MPQKYCKEYKNKCESYHVPFRIFSTRAELGQSLGKSERVNIGVIDSGFATAYVDDR